MPSFSPGTPAPSTGVARGSSDPAAAALADRSALSCYVDTDPWLLVTYTDGRTDLIGLKRLFLDAPKIASIDTLSPPGLSALLRILAAFTYRITGLDDPSLPVDAWHDARTAALAAGAFEADQVHAYFTQWHERLNLFDATWPWLQDPRLRTESIREGVPATSGLNSLLVDRPAGNTPAWWSDFHDANPGTAPISEAVDGLLVRQFYGPSGTGTHRHLPDGTKIKGFAYAGPLRGRLSYHPTGPTLFHTLLAHLVPPITIAVRTEEDTALDLPEWEAPVLPDPTGSKPPPVGILSLLANNSAHALLLVPDLSPDGTLTVVDCYFTGRYLVPRGDTRPGWDPYLSYSTVRLNEKDKQVPAPLLARPVEPGRDLWRDLPALLGVPVHRPGRQHRIYVPPRAVAGLSRLPHSLRTQIRVAAYGFQQDGKTKNFDWSAALTPAVFAAVSTDPAGSDYLTSIHDWALAADVEWDELSRALNRACAQAYNLHPVKDRERATAWSRIAASLYWQRAYVLFDEALGAPDGTAFAATVATAPPRLRRASVQIYDRVTAAVRDGRGLLAVTRHRPRFLSTPTVSAEEPAA